LYLVLYNAGLCYKNCEAPSYDGIEIPSISITSINEVVTWLLLLICDTTWLGFFEPFVKGVLDWKYSFQRSYRTHFSWIIYIFSFDTF
jgi:hypothetical protein